MSGIMSMVLGAKTAIAAAVDAYFNLVTLLLPGDGTNGAQNNTFLDSSSNNFTITRNGNTTQGTFSPFSQTGWSNYFDGTGDYLTGTITAVNNTTMTMECWVWLNAFDNVDGDHLLQVDNGANTNYAITHNGNGAARFLSRNNTGGAIFDLTSANSILQTNKWHHIVGVRNASAASLYVDGTRVATVSSPTVSSTDGTSLKIAYNVSASPREPNGYISNARIVSGTAVYDPTSSSLTVPTSPLTAVSGTRILTCQSNRFVDNSGNNVALTITGTPSVQAFSPFAPTAAYSAVTNGGSGYFDGTGDYLSVASSSSLNPSGVSYTVDFWMYPTSYPNANCMVFEVGNASTGDMQCLLLNTGKIRFQIGGSAGSEANITLNQWQYITCVKSGTNFTVYVNAVAGTTVALTPNSKTTMFIGAQTAGANPFAGYLCGFRTVSGSANVPSSVPTAPPSPTGSTLCLNFTNAGITDATAKNDLETVGNAQISTTQSKFGGSSMYFDGTGDWLTAYNPGGLFTLGTVYTVELWFYTTTVAAGNAGIVNLATNASSTNTGLNIYRSSAEIVVDDGATANTGPKSGASSITANTWIHLAVVSNGTTTKVYLDGVEKGSYNGTTGSANAMTYITVGAFNTKASPFNGYIDDLRITKGVARTITVPTAAYPLS